MEAAMDFSTTTALVTGASAGLGRAPAIELPRGGGTVVNISSDAAVSAYPRWGAYGVAKAGLDHLTRIWAAELEPHGVKLFAVDPGEMDTAMHRAAIPDADPASLADPREVARRL